MGFRKLNIPCWRGLPVWRRERLFFSAVSLGFLVVLLSTFAISDYEIMRTVRLIAVLPAPVLGMAILRTNTRRRRLLRSNNLHVCYYCDEVLSSLGPSGDCPRCGRAYNKADLELRWLNWL